MSDVDIALKELQSELLEQPIVQEYFRLSKLVKEDPNLSMWDKFMREHQKKMGENLNNDDVYFKEKAEYEKYLALLQNDPLLANYEAVKNEVANLLEEIKKVLD